MRHALFIALFSISALGCSKSEKSEKSQKSKSEPASAVTNDARPPAAKNKTYTVYPNLAAAVTALLARRPRVVGFGEYHATKSGPKVVSSLSRFRQEVLPAVAGALSDLVVETWVEPSGCSKKATEAGEEVRVAIERPEETESDLFALLREARERDIGAHILEMSCKDYETFKSAGELDYDKPMSIVSTRLLATIEKALATESPAAIAVYGGSMHNDTHPIKGFEAYSYVPRVTALTKNRFLEIDIFVPELIAESALFKGQPWFEIAKREASPDHVVVIERSPTSYVIMLKSEVTATASP